MDWMIPPGLILALGGLLVPAMPGRAARVATVTLPLIALLQLIRMASLPEVSLPTLQLFTHLTLTPVVFHDYTLIFATVFCMAALAGGVYAQSRFSAYEIAAAYLYAGSAVGATMAGDLVTFFMYWEVMAIGSTVLIWQGGTEAARRAGMRYALLHFLGGVVLLAGIVAYVAYDPLAHMGMAPVTLQAFGNDAMGMMPLVGGYLILLGILINAAAVPLSAWLPDAYPEASPVGTVFLSAFTTKTAVFALLTLFPGLDLLIPVGLVMVFYGIVYAILENDMRRILAYSIVNQVGFMLVGIGIGTPLALYGAAAHAFCHIIYKALLLMSAGAVLHMTGKRRCSDLGGLYHSMPLTTLCGIIGALAISGFPFTSGFISKSLTSAAAAEQHMAWVWGMLLAASAGVFLHAGIKYPWFVFFQKDSGLRPADPPAGMRIAMLVLAGWCIIPGVWPELVYGLLPATPEYQPNTAAHVVTQLQLLLFSGLAFFLMLPWLQRTLTISLDADWFYRIGAQFPLLQLERAWYGMCRRATDAANAMGRSGLRAVSACCSPRAVFVRTMPLGAVLMVMLLFLAGVIAAYYL